jgi:hypothetical protein
MKAPGLYLMMAPALLEYDDLVKTLNTTLGYQAYKDTAVSQLEAFGLAD